ALPGILSVIVMVLFLRERKRPAVAKPEEAPAAEVAPTKTEKKGSVRASALGTRFWLFTIISTVFALGNSSDAFIFLRSAGLEQSVVLVPLMYFGYNFVYAG